MARPALTIKSLTFSDGQTYEFDPQDKVLLVGPNNSGKSLSLREIRQIVSTNGGQSPFEFTKCIVNLELRRTGSSTELRDFIVTKGVRDVTQPYGPIYLVGPYRINADTSDWFNSTTLGDISNIYFRHVSTENRLHASIMSPSVSAGEQKTTAQQFLYENPDLFEIISDVFQSAFGDRLIIDYRGGSSIPIHVGRIPEKVDGEDRVSNAYVQKVRELPRLDHQGDGMRGYAGILFEATVTPHDVTLIDEPEAFLHPPQMRRLAQALASNNSSQLFISTHSSDILRGWKYKPDNRDIIGRFKRTME